MQMKNTFLLSLSVISAVFDTGRVSTRNEKKLTPQDFYLWVDELILEGEGHEFLF